MAPNLTDAGWLNLGAASPRDDARCIMWCELPNYEYQWLGV